MLGRTQPHPGQGSLLYDQRIAMRPDWEAVVPGMVDALIKHPHVDPTRIVLAGRSFGGLIAPRGASGEPRLTCPKEFRLFTKAEGAEGHCEGMAPTIFWTAAFDWLDHLLA